MYTSSSTCRTRGWVVLMVSRVLRSSSRISQRAAAVTVAVRGRPDSVDIVGRIAATPGVQDVAMTTNAILLPRLARPLADAGLRRVNVHVDTFDPERLKKVMDDAPPAGQ